jgi:hypothetical protein
VSGCTPDQMKTDRTTSPPRGPRHRNCNENLDDLEWNRPDSHCEPQQAGDILRNLQPDETIVIGVGGAAACLCPVRVKVAEFGVSLRGEWGVDGDDVAVGEQGRGVDEGDAARRCPAGAYAPWR